MMLEDVLAPAGRRPANARPVWIVAADSLKSGAIADGAAVAWAEQTGFKAAAGEVLVVPDGKGGIAGVVLGTGDGDDPMVAGALARKLPAGDWYFEAAQEGDLRLASLGFLLGAYRFTRYRKSSGETPRLVLGASLDREEIAMAEAQLQVEHYWAGALRRAVIDGDIENGSLMAGQSVGMLKQEEPVAAIIEKLMAQSEDALTRRG